MLRAMAIQSYTGLASTVFSPTASAEVVAEACGFWPATRARLDAILEQQTAGRGGGGAVHVEGPAAAALPKVSLNEDEVKWLTTVVNAAHEFGSRPNVPVPVAVQCDWHTFAFWGIPFFMGQLNNVSYLPHDAAQQVLFGLRWGSTFERCVLIGFAPLTLAILLLLALVDVAMLGVALALDVLQLVLCLLFGYGIVRARKYGLFTRTVSVSFMLHASVTHTLLETRWESSSCVINSSKFDPPWQQISFWETCRTPRFARVFEHMAVREAVLYYQPRAAMAVAVLQNAANPNPNAVYMRV